MAGINIDTTIVTSGKFGLWLYRNFTEFASTPVNIFSIIANKLFVSSLEEAISFGVATLTEGRLWCPAYLSKRFLYALIRR